MPMIILSVDQIMDREKRDMYFLDLKGVTFDPAPAKMAARKQHFDWCKVNKLKIKIAAPRGWLEGDPGLYAIHFSADDPLVATYTALFERPDGISLYPEVYQMDFLTYQSWLDHDGPKHMTDLARDDW
jgi:hypothetical protein